MGSNSSLQILPMAFRNKGQLKNNSWSKIQGTLSNESAWKLFHVVKLHQCFNLVLPATLLTSWQGITGTQNLWINSPPVHIQILYSTEVLGEKLFAYHSNSNNLHLCLEIVPKTCVHNWAVFLVLLDSLGRFYQKGLGLEIPSPCHKKKKKQQKTPNINPAQNTVKRPNKPSWTENSKKLILEGK